MLDDSHIERLYKGLLHDMQVAFRCKRYDKLLRLADGFADVAQQFNDILVSDELESLLERTAQAWLSEWPENTAVSTPPPHKLTTSPSLFFYDQIGSIDCLALQYVQAFCRLGYQVHYLFESAHMPYDERLGNQLRAMGVEVSVYQHHYAPTRELFATIRQQILQSGADTVFVHSPAAGALGAIVLHSLPQLRRCRIVPGDHHFYLGVRCIDEFVEFRYQGLYNAVLRRGIDEARLHCLPYHPIVNETIEFQSFPDAVKGKVVLLAAGAEYKFYGSDLFFKMVEQLLQRYEQAVVLFCSKPTVRMHRFVQEKGLADRFFFLGYRSDFARCVEHCDILLSSYPMVGGLISQYAAYYAKPILACREAADQGLPQRICSLLGREDDEQSEPTRVWGPAFDEYAHRLLNEETFRRQEGLRLQSLLTTPQAFEQALNAVLHHQVADVREERFRVALSQGKSLVDVWKARDFFVPIYRKTQLALQPTLLFYLLRTCGLKTFVQFPFLLPLACRHIRYTWHCVASYLYKSYVLRLLKK